MLVWFNRTNFLGVERTSTSSLQQFRVNLPLLIKFCSRTSPRLQTNCRFAPTSVQSDCSLRDNVCVVPRLATLRPIFFSMMHVDAQYIGPTHPVALADRRRAEEEEKEESVGYETKRGGLQKARDAKDVGPRVEERTGAAGTGRLWAAVRAQRAERV